MRRIPAFTLMLALACGGAAFAAQDHDGPADKGSLTLHQMGAELKAGLHRLGAMTRHALHRADVAAHRTSRRDEEQRRS